MTPTLYEHIMKLIEMNRVIKKQT